MALRVLTWNLEWASRRSARGEELRARIRAEAPDVVCVTEASSDILADTGFTVTGGADWGYVAPEGRRKVLRWSRTPWSHVDAVGSSALPPGRFVAATTETALGPLRCNGVCIPWRDAHVRTGRADSARWQQHLTYVQALRPLLARPSTMSLVLGDFNQTMPRTRAPENVHAALTVALGDHWTVATKDLHDPIGRPAIDHIAHSGDLCATDPRTLSAAWPKGALSDHFGIVATLAHASAQSRRDSRSAAVAVGHRCAFVPGPPRVPATSPRAQIWPGARPVPAGTTPTVTVAHPRCS